MNRSLRRSHLRRISVLSVLVPLGFGAALMGRVDYPGGKSRPETERDAIDESPGAAGSITQIQVAGVPVRLELFIGRDDQPGRVLLNSNSTLPQPDVLVYWDSREKPADGELPSEAFFLGPFSGADEQSLRLPDQAPGGGGRIIFYSLGHAEVLGAGVLPRIKRTGN